MAYELVKEQVFLDQCVGSEQAQIMLEGDIIVPDARPDMAVLLQTEEKIIIDRTEVSADRVNILGRLNISLLYIAKTSEQPVCAVTLSRPIDDFINVDGVTKDMWVTAKAEISHIDYRMLNDRKVNYRAIINIHASAERSDAHEMVVHIHDVPENQLLKNNLSINRTIEHKQERFSVKDSLPLPASKPGVREVLLVSANITNRDVRISSGRVNLSGELLVTTLYRGDTDDSIIEFVESELPFNGPIDVPGTKDDMFADVALQVMDHHVQIRQDDDGEDRVLEIEVSVGVQLKVYSTEVLPILEDAYCINQRLTLSKTQVRFPRLVCLNRNQAPIKEVVTLGSAAPNMLQIFRVKGNAYLDEVKVIEDKIVVEGAITTDILYVAESDAAPLGSFRTVIPFRQVIEAKNARPNMRVTVDTSIDHTAFSLLSGRETEIRFLLTFNTQVIQEEAAHIAHNIEFADLEPETLAAIPSMTVYIVQQGDTLWKIAKRYNTAIDELLAVNDIEHPGRISPEQKLLILKKGL